MIQGLLILIFVRPFIASLAFPCLNLGYSVLLAAFLPFWFMRYSAPVNLKKQIQYPLILFILSILVSLFFSANKPAGYAELYKYVTGILLFFICVSLRDESDCSRIISILVIAGVIISCLAIYQYFFGFRHILNYMERHRLSDSFALDYISRRRVFSPFVTPNTLGGYLAMIVPLALIQRRGRLLIMPLAIALILTQSIGSLLSIAFAAAAYFYLRGGPKKNGIIIVSGMAAVITLIFILRGAAIREHTHPAFSTLMRLNYWQDTLRMIASHPLIGVGPGNFNLALTRHAHNSYLQIWAEMGIIGIASFIWLIIAVFRSALKNISGSPYKHRILCLLASSAVFLIHNFMDFSFYLPEVSLLWWVITGLLLSFQGL